MQQINGNDVILMDFLQIKCVLSSFLLWAYLQIFFLLNGLLWVDINNMVGGIFLFNVDSML